MFESRIVQLKTDENIGLDIGDSELKIIHGFNIGPRREALLISEAKNNIL